MIAIIMLILMTTIIMLFILMITIILIFHDTITLIFPDDNYAVDIHESVHWVSNIQNGSWFKKLRMKSINYRSLHISDNFCMFRNSH